MELFELTQATDVAQAVGALAKSASAEQASDVRIIAGGTTMVDLMRLDVVVFSPDQVLPALRKQIWM